MADIAGVGKLVTPVPPAKTVPPVEAAYQSIVRFAPEIVAVIATELLPQTAYTVVLTGAEGIGLMVAVTAVLTDERQPVARFLVCA